jgi:hypothetical protein
MAAPAASIPPLPDTWLQDAGHAASPGLPPPSPPRRWAGGTGGGGRSPLGGSRRSASGDITLQLRRGIPLKAGLTRLGNWWQLPVMTTLAMAAQPASDIGHRQLDQRKRLRRVKSQAKWDPARADCHGSPRGSPPAVTRWDCLVLAELGSNLSCTNSTQDHCVDADHQPTDLVLTCSFGSAVRTTACAILALLTRASQSRCS